MLEAEGRSEVEITTLRDDYDNRVLNEMGEARGEIRRHRLPGPREPVAHGGHHCDADLHAGCVRRLGGSKSP